MEIKRLGAGDHLLLATAIQTLDPGGSRDGRVASEAHLRRVLDDPSCYFIVSVHDATPVGYLSAFRFPATDADGFHVYLFDVVVDVHYRRRGIGSRLIAELEARCREDGAVTIWAGTSLDNLAARKTFERTGASRLGERYVEYVFTLDRDAPSV